MQLVLSGAVTDEGVVVAAELAHHVAQTEDGSEEELGVVAAGRRRAIGLVLLLRAGKPRFGVNALG